MDEHPAALELGARRLVAEVWRLVENHVIDARSPAGDAALDLRDVIDPNWQPVAEDERERVRVPRRVGDPVRDDG